MVHPSCLTFLPLQSWNDELFSALKAAGGRAYSNYAVGYNNVVVPDATNHGIPVGNTPGVLTETTAELAASLTFAAARRVVEADVFMRAGKYTGWLPTLFVGSLLQVRRGGGAWIAGWGWSRQLGGLGVPPPLCNLPAWQGSDMCSSPPGPAPAQGKTVGVIGAGRIGTAYARMMVEGHKMDLAYYGLQPNEELEQYVK